MKLTNKWAAFVNLMKVVLVLGPVLTASNADTRIKPKPPKRPNILFIILDDWGIDQAKSFSYGGRTPPKVPTLDAIAAKGMKFSNVWAMPECSPSRVAMFTGRYPMRTAVLSALLSEDLANSQMSYFESTTPKVLQEAGYTSGLFGKYHLGGPDNNPFGNLAPAKAGWDHFDGSLFGAPPFIDTTAGGVAAEGTYSCGFDNGQFPGACYFDDGNCSEIAPNSDYPTPGRRCMEEGGIFVRNQICEPLPPEGVDFSNFNGYYVWPQTITDGSNLVLDSKPKRQYGTTQTTDAAIAWIKKQQEGSQPWMATLSYNAIHTPYQQAPDALLPETGLSSRLPNSLLDCSTLPAQRILGNQMAEAMDREIGRLLVETGIARRDSKDKLHYNPRHSDTMIVWIGDNGTFFPNVKLPFDPTRSKGTPYQTGVWVGMAVSGPLLHPDNIGRSVNHMINVTDLFELWGEIAGLDVRSLVPDSHVLDSRPVLPYLTDPRQRSIRKINFSQLGTTLKSPGDTLWPCVLNLGPVQACTDILFTSEEICELENGTWYGPGNSEFPQGLPSCCAVLDATGNEMLILPQSTWTTRNNRYKLVRSQVENCQTDQTEINWEFYRINERKKLPRIDRAEQNLLAGSLNRKEQKNCRLLFNELEDILNSETGDNVADNGQVYCLGDGNLDKVVNQQDLACVEEFADNASGGSSPGLSSWCDMNFDGLTNGDDQQIVIDNFGKDCSKNPVKIANDLSPCGEWLGIPLPLSNHLHIEAPAGLHPQPSLHRLRRFHPL